jgi:putative ABC transport system ATP-binding protein
MIELRQTKRVHRLGSEEIQALDSVDLTIGAGEFGVIAPSDSDKSTLSRPLRCGLW